MKKPDISIIDQPWLENELEHVDACPYCRSRDRTLAYKDVQDWSFYCAPGKWIYWDCQKCKSLYLDPRPTLNSIGKAYGVYYTHAISNKTKILTRLKNKLKSECFENWYGNTKSSSFYRLLLSPFRAKLFAPFWMEALAKIPPKGRLLDVGCGDGTVLEWATKLGWCAIGIEVDPLAVASGRRKGLEVIEGTYEKLSNIQGQFDCVVCLHVVEHVHNPIDLLERLTESLKPNGVLIIATPNATSQMRTIFQENWRGLEAPRHLAIPDLTSLKLHLEKLGFRSVQQFTNANLTGVESSRIQRRALVTSAKDKEKGIIKHCGQEVIGDERDDIIQFFCQKSL